MYCITVTLCFLQSSQNWEAENFLLRKMVIPGTADGNQVLAFISAL